MQRLTKTPNVLSFDCGIRNLSFCFLCQSEEGDNMIILAWQNINLEAGKMSIAVERLVQELDARPWMRFVDHVAIESQLQENAPMKAISHAIQTYFLVRTCDRGMHISLQNENEGSAVDRFKARLVGTCDSCDEECLIVSNTNETRLADESSSSDLESETALLPLKGPVPVHFISAQSKFKVIKVTEPVLGLNGHKRNKRIAEEMCRTLLGMKGQHEALGYFEKAKKKDDLADSYLQGCYFLKQLKTRTRTLAKKKEVKLGRKAIIPDQSEERANGGLHADHQVYKRLSDDNCDSASFWGRS